MTRTGWHLCRLAFNVWCVIPLWPLGPRWYQRINFWLLAWAGVYANSTSLEDYNARMNERFREGRCQAPD